MEKKILRKVVICGKVYDYDHNRFEKDRKLSIKTIAQSIGVTSPLCLFAIRQIVDILSKHAEKISEDNTKACNGEISEDEFQGKHKAMRLIVEDAIKPFDGLVYAEVGSDPRGFGIKLFLPDHESNSAFGGEGWGIPERGAYIE